MSAAAVLAGLAAAGTTVATGPAGKLCLRGSPPPAELRAAVPRVGWALLSVASGRWRLELAGWPAWRRGAYQERVAVMAEGGAPADLVEQLAYLDVVDLPEPTLSAGQAGKQLAAAVASAEALGPTGATAEAPGIESADARAARFGYVIMPWGEYLEADRVDDTHRAPFQARFDVRWRPERTGTLP